MPDHPADFWQALPTTIQVGAARFPIRPEGVTIGRENDNDIVISSPNASRAHARVFVDAGGCHVQDLGSTNRTLVNGKAIGTEPVRVVSGDVISIADQMLLLAGGEATAFVRNEAVAPSAPTAEEVPLTGGRLTIGRDPANDLVLSDPNVSRFHAEIVGSELRDRGSRHGTRLGGLPVKRARLTAGAEIGIGPFKISYDGVRLRVRDDRGALTLEVLEASFSVADKVILRPTSFAVAPGEFVAIIGESGSGKTTLMKLLAGVTAPTSGLVLLNGEPVAVRQTDLGYVPQDDIVHRLLTAREALRFGAQLRLPLDTSDAEIDAAVDRVVGELALAEHADTLVGSLSGGQRKRVGVAMELLSGPGLLCLDEPTTGLDPGLETRMMELMRRLSEGARAVVTVTHSTKNLDLVDKLVVMGRGGRLLFCGPPREALAHFGAADYDAIYLAAEADRPPSSSQSVVRRAVTALRARPSVLGRSATPGRSSVGAHARVLAARHRLLLLRDRRNLLLLLGQVPLLALLIAILYDRNVFGIGQPRDAATVLFLVVITTTWLGAIDAAREIVKERAVLARESSVGVSLGAYLSAKLLVLGTLATVQTLILAAIVFQLMPLTVPASGYAITAAILVATSIAAVAMGLLISAVVRSEDQAGSFIPLALIPLLLFAGALKPLHVASGAVDGLAALTFTRWSFAGVGHAAKLYDKTGPSADGFDELYGPSFFDLSGLVTVLLMLAFTVLFAAGVAVILRARPH
jgi:ABC transport system ATP-binding/permease protein